MSKDKISLKEFVLAKIEALDRRSDQTERDAKEALRKAETAIERRLDLLNEFRAQSADESKKYLTQTAYNERHESLITRCNSLETQVARLYGGLVVIGFIGVANMVKVWFTN